MRPRRPRAIMPAAPTAADPISNPSESEETDTRAGSDVGLEGHVGADWTTGALAAGFVAGAPSSGPSVSVVEAEPVKATLAGSGAGAWRSGDRTSATDDRCAGVCPPASAGMAYPGVAAIAAAASAATSAARPVTSMREMRCCCGSCMSYSLNGWLRALGPTSVSTPCAPPLAPMLRSGCVALRAPGEDAVQVDFRVLGPVEVVNEGRSLDLGGRRRRGLLALLLLHAPEALTAERLIEELWADEAAGISAKTLHAHVSRLRT